MNRKLVNGLLLLTLVTGGCGVFTSCKDADEDYKNEIVKGQVGLESSFANLKTQLDNLKTQVDGIKSCECDPNLKQDLINEINNLETRLNADIAKRLTAGEVDDAIDAKIKDLNSYINSLQGEDGIIKKLQNDIAGKADAEDVTKLEAALNNLKDQVKDLNDSITEYLLALQDRIDSLITSIELNQTWNPIFGSINFPIGLSTSIAGNYYGTSETGFSFPIDVTKSDDLGHDASDLAVLIEKNPKLAEALTALVKDAPKYEVKAGEIYMSDLDNNLGQLYMTFNPNNVDLSNVELTLVNSVDEAAPGITLTAEKVTDEVLSFGITTRGAEDNGLYRINVKADKENVEELSIKIQDGLKSAMKDALKSPTKSDLASLAKLLYDQMQNILPAYAVKASWDAPYLTRAEGDEGEEEAPIVGQLNKDSKSFATYSKFNIAATAFQPLGYGFLKDHNFNKLKLPTYGGTIESAINKIFDKANFNFDFGELNISGLDTETLKININDVKFNPTSIEIDLSTVLDGAAFADPENTKLVLGYNPNTGEVSNPNDTALNGLIESIQKSINEMLKGADNNGGLQKEINDLLQNQVAAQVNTMISDVKKEIKRMSTTINTQLNQKITDIKNSILGKVGKFDKLLDKYNSIAQKFNSIIENPNHYVQVVGLYEDNNHALAQLSSNQYDPTRFVIDGDGLTLYVTSYTGDIIAPSFKKYVAVSRVIGAGEQTADEIAAAKEVNDANEFLNALIPGHTQSIVIDANSLDPKYIYEVVYTSLDYTGQTSTRVYYIALNK